MAKATQKQETRGGAREGAGRPKGIHTPIKTPEDKAVTISLSVPGELHRVLKEQAAKEGTSVNDLIRVTLKSVFACHLGKAEVK